MLALALQGIGGMNSFAAGVLQTLRKKGVNPDLISATNGSILSTFYFLQKDPNAIEKYYDDYFKSEDNGIPTFLNSCNTHIWAFLINFLLITSTFWKDSVTIGLS